MTWKLNNIYIFAEKTVPCKRLTQQANAVLRSCLFQLRQLRSVCRLLPVEAAKTLVSAFVTSRLDYYNSILIEQLLQSIVSYNQFWMLLPGSLLASASSTAYRPSFAIFTGCGSLSESTTSWLWRLGGVWCQRGRGTTHCDFIGAIDFRGDRLTAVSSYEGRAHLRSANRDEILVPRCKTRMGERSFFVAGPRVWNSLPTDIRCTDNSWSLFLTSLKYMFNLSHY